MSASLKSRALVTQCAAGLALGFSLAYIGFGDYAELHKMFTFADLRLLWTFAGAVGVTLVGLRCFVRRDLPRRAMHKGVVIGGALFGVGWAVTGACPGIVLVQLGQGTVGALSTLLGIVLGARIFDALNGRFLRWPTGSSCGE